MRVRVRETKITKTKQSKTNAIFQTKETKKKKQTNKGKYTV